MTYIEHFTFSRYPSVEKLYLSCVHAYSKTHIRKQFHDHTFSELAIVINGKAEHISEQESCPLTRGDVLLLQPGDVHTYVQAETMEIVNLIYDAGHFPLPGLDTGDLPLFRLLFPTTKYKRNFVKPILHLEENLLDPVLKRCLDFEHVIYNAVPARTTQAYLAFLDICLKLALLFGMRDNQKKSFSMIDPALNFITRKFCEKISMESLARLSNMSERTFLRHFRNVTGQAPSQYILQLRLKHAMELLSHTEQSITEIALSLGFYDTSDFCRKFKAAAGISPRKLRITQKSGQPQ